MPVPTIHPCLRYRDAPRMVDWLRTAFGFEPILVVAGADGTIVHAELALGDAVVMLGSEKPDAFGSSPLTAGRVTGAVYVATDGIDALAERARSAGAEVFHGPADTDYGSREFACRDPEGGIWSFGTYRPAPRG